MKKIEMINVINNLKQNKITPEDINTLEKFIEQHSKIHKELKASHAMIDDYIDMIKTVGEIGNMFYSMKYTEKQDGSAFVFYIPKDKLNEYDALQLKLSNLIEKNKELFKK